MFSANLCFSLFFKIENSTHNQPNKQIAEIAGNAETAFSITNRVRNTPFYFKIYKTN